MRGRSIDSNGSSGDSDGGVGGNGGNGGQRGFDADAFVANEVKEATRALARAHARVKAAESELVARWRPVSKVSMPHASDVAQDIKHMVKTIRRAADAIDDAKNSLA